jgi:peptidoglycan hydrolase-like protein with peptidoglycan-binding domain
MYKPDNVFRVFHNAIGNKRHNDYDDVSNAKHKFKRLGYYKDAVKNGYIDESLIKSITSYQRDNDLNIDGYMMLCSACPKAPCAMIIAALKQP